MITADQILAHLIGDYIFQSHWMAQNKTKSTLPAVIHAMAYTTPFTFITANPIALALIMLSHFVIDRWRLSRFVVWAKNGPWLPLTPTGYQDDVPAWLSVWLLIIADNTIHIACNGLIIWWTA
jgi:hypothetical protein